MVMAVTDHPSSRLVLIVHVDWQLIQEMGRPIRVCLQGFSGQVKGLRISVEMFILCVFHSQYHTELSSVSKNVSVILKISLCVSQMKEPKIYILCDCSDTSEFGTIIFRWLG